MVIPNNNESNIFNSNDNIYNYKGRINIMILDIIAIKMMIIIKLKIKKY